MPVLVLENLRSAYNVWNCIRTADALGREIILSWYTPSPESTSQVHKTSLWAEHYVGLMSFWNTSETLYYLKKNWYVLVAAETQKNAIMLNRWHETYRGSEQSKNDMALIMGNERSGILPETLAQVDYTVMIPMKGHKESLNVWQAAAICMRELSKRHI